MESGLPALSALESELMDMWDVLLGHAPPPISHRAVDALMEVANAYYARAQFIAAMIQRGERQGAIDKHSMYSKFRTGELRTFIEVAGKTTELGSRRITMQQLKQEGERTGRTQRDFD
jgi:hypothetical protein